MAYLPIRDRLPSVPTLTLFLWIGGESPQPSISIILEFETYIINMMSSDDLEPSYNHKGGDSMGEIVVIPVPDGTEIICE